MNNQDQNEPEHEQEQGGQELEAEEVTQQAAVDEASALRQELETAKAQAAEYLDGWQRARAELANARKRFQREQDQAYQNAKADVLVHLLPIVDDLERALRTVPGNPSDPTWIEGVRLIQHKFATLLEQQGVTVIEAAGQEFDPLLHEAVTHEPSETVQAGYVIAELQKGYKVGDRVLRPSSVRVSSGVLSEPKAGAEPDRE